MVFLYMSNTVINYDFEALKQGNNALNRALDRLKMAAPYQVNKINLIGGTNYTAEQIKEFTEKETIRIGFGAKRLIQTGIDKKDENGTLTQAYLVNKNFLYYSDDDQTKWMLHEIGHSLLDNKKTRLVARATVVFGKILTPVAAVLSTKFPEASMIAAGLYTATVTANSYIWKTEKRADAFSDAIMPETSWTSCMETSNMNLALIPAKDIKKRNLFKVAAHFLMAKRNLPLQERAFLSNKRLCEKETSVQINPDLSTMSSLSMSKQK